MKKLVAFLLISLAFVACTDYEADYEDTYGNLLVTYDEEESSSSEEADPESSQTDESSSSSEMASSSSGKNESSSSSNAESSSSKISSSSMKTAWDCLNPYISYGEMTDSRDGLVYKTVIICNQTWMAENLNYAYNKPTSSLDSSSFCYNNSADSCFKYGRLYLWSAAMDSSAVFSDDGKGCGYGATCSAGGNVRGVCPEGWRLPSEDEWNTLFTAVGGIGTAGTVLKATSGWYDSGNGEDSFGFSVLPAGYRNGNGYFNNAGNDAYFWSSTEDDSTNAYGWFFYYDYARVRKNLYDRYYAFSVRCVRKSVDEGSESSSSSSSGENESSSSSIAESSSSKVVVSSSSSLAESSSSKVVVSSSSSLAESSSSKVVVSSSSSLAESSSSEVVVLSSSSLAESSSSKVVVLSSSSLAESSSSKIVASSSSSIAESSSSEDIVSSSSIEYGSLTDSRDNQTYKTVTIGTQTWMAENLNYAYNKPTSSLDSSSFCYNNSADSCSKYGRLYLWSAAMDSAAVFSDDGKGCGYDATCSASGIVRGVCPEGWHLPSETEWDTLFTAVGGISSAGTVLKSTSGWYDSGNGEDSFGFSVLPAGFRFNNGDFDDAGNLAGFWSSTENWSYDAYYWHFDDAYVIKLNFNKDAASSVRCVRN